MRMRSLRRESAKRCLPLQPPEYRAVKVLSFCARRPMLATSWSTTMDLSLTVQPVQESPLVQLPTKT